MDVNYEKSSIRREYPKPKSIILIMLIVLISVLIFYNIFKGYLENTVDKIESYETKIDIKIVSVYLDEEFINVTIIRNSGAGNLTGVVFRIEGKEISEIFIEKGSLNELEMETYKLEMISLKSSDAIKISVTPIFILNEDKEVVGNVKDEYRFSWLN